MIGTSALIVGSGGREHAIGMAMADNVDYIYFAPGNAGTETMPYALNVDVPIDKLRHFVVENAVDLTIIGPEVPLVEGLADDFRRDKLAVVGPNRGAALLEGSKCFASGFMSDHDIPQPDTTLIRDERSLLKALAIKDPKAIVIKANGLAAGKGVVLPKDRIEMVDALIGMYSGDWFSGAGKNDIVLQERLTGPEVSAFVLSDGNKFVTLPFTQDHKRLRNNDKGPNTGGMGAYAPVADSIVSSKQTAQIEDIAERTIAGMNADGTPYKGILYMGIMLADQRDGDPVVIEYNVRFGDPEAQVLMPILKRAGVDIFELLRSSDSVLREDLLSSASELGGSALSVCLAAEGYPDRPEKGDEILGLAKNYEDVLVHHGGTRRTDDGRIVTNGGRVLYVTGIGETVDDAAAKAYSAIGGHAIDFVGMQYRTDIGDQARGSR